MHVCRGLAALVAGPAEYEAGDGGTFVCAAATAAKLCMGNPGGHVGRCRAREQWSSARDEAHAGSEVSDAVGERVLAAEGRKLGRHLARSIQCVFACDVE